MYQNPFESENQNDNNDDEKYELKISDGSHKNHRLYGKNINL